jgi:glycosyltransferase involved in cell wall biosynthesis
MDPVTRKLRRGALLRALYPPDGVKYLLSKGSPNFGRSIGSYSVGVVNMSASVIRYLANGIRSPGNGFDIEHTFFWSLARHSAPWFHENDQSASQFLKLYAGLNGFPMRRVKDLLLAQARSTLFRGFVVWSNWAKNGFIEDGFDPDLINVIPPPVPVKETKEKDTGEGYNILFVGRDFRRKGGDAALLIFSRIKKTIPQARLLYVGPIEGLTLPQGVIHFENPDDATLFYKIYPSADIFLMPTRVDAFGISLVEAMSFGIPPVTSNVGSIPEYVNDGYNGYVHEKDDIDSMVESVLTLLQSGKQRRSLGGRAKDTVRDKFSPEVVGGKIRRLYDAAV